MLFSRIRIERSASDYGADSLRTGALPADLPDVAGESKDRARVRDAILDCDSEAPYACGDGFAGLNWGAHADAAT